MVPDQTSPAVSLNRMNWVVKPPPSAECGNTICEEYRALQRHSMVSMMKRIASMDVLDILPQHSGRACSLVDEAFQSVASVFAKDGTRNARESHRRPVMIKKVK